ncbi:MAG TPA: hypothetical protein VFF73_05525 [Planctomycetota bacterium]|nr:hypothetical protein [Planctomycetota bacterium]
MHDPVEPDARWQPYEESLVTTIARTVAIAAAVGAVVASRMGWGRWPLATLLALWPSFGGHWVEIVFLNHLRPSLPVARGVQVVARLAVWFVGGVGLGLGVWLTATRSGFPLPNRASWWVAGLAFIGIELVAHLALWIRRRPSFYDGRG